MAYELTEFDRKILIRARELIATGECKFICHAVSIACLRIVNKPWNIFKWWKCIESERALKTAVARAIFPDLTLTNLVYSNYGYALIMRPAENILIRLAWIDRMLETGVIK